MAWNEPGYIDASSLDGTAADAQMWLSSSPAGAIYRSFGIDPAARVDEAAVQAEIRDRQSRGLAVDNMKTPLGGSIVEQIRAKHTERGGTWVTLPDTRPQWQQAMEAQAAAAGVRMASQSPAGKDAEWQRLESIARARFEAARARRDAVLGPLAGTVSFGEPEFPEL